MLGIAHPTGYPLYLLLGKLWTLIPFGSVAWRLNIGTAVYGLIAAWLLFSIVRHLFPADDPPPYRDGVAALSAALAATLPIFWSQSIAAEVYTLHQTLLLLVLRIIQIIWRRSTQQRWLGIRAIVWLAFLLGLGLTNHLTALFMLPVAAVALLIGGRQPADEPPLVFGRYSVPLPLFGGGRWGALLVAFCLPLLLYAYLPLRWQAVNGEPMGWQRFGEWVIGGRFQGALVTNAWLQDPTRYEVVGRLFLNEWPIWLLVCAGIGLLTLWIRAWRMGLIVSLILGGFAFYCLNYYVPDLAVFLLPSQLMLAICVGATGLLLYDLMWRWLSTDMRPLGAWLLLIGFGMTVLWLTADRFPGLDRSGDDGLVGWGEAVFDQNPAAGGVILADSEKIAPLYYLQQAEGRRSDLDIMVLPDENAYRTELDQRVSAGEAVYLARFLPNLAGSYTLQGFGPLTEVRAEPVFDEATEPIFRFEAGGATIELLDLSIIPQSRYDAGSAELTLRWRLVEPPDGAAADGLCPLGRRSADRPNRLPPG